MPCVGGPEWDQDKWGPAPPPPPSTDVVDRERTSRAARPVIVDVFALLMALSMLSVVYGLAASWGWFCAVLVLAIDLPLIYLFWQGNPWMRYLTMASAIVGVACAGIVLLLPPHQLGALGPMMKLNAALNGAFSVALLIALNTRAVRDYFAPR
jgi:hypothetical protein